MGFDAGGLVDQFIPSITTMIDNFRCRDSKMVVGEPIIPHGTARLFFDRIESEAFGWQRE